jgi:hypothetical protein
MTQVQEEIDIGGPRIARIAQDQAAAIEVGKWIGYGDTEARAGKAERVRGSRETGADKRPDAFRDCDRISRGERDTDQYHRREGRNSFSSVPPKNMARWRGD